MIKSLQVTSPHMIHNIYFFKVPIIFTVWNTIWGGGVGEDNSNKKNI